jgi:FtsP/CotA-like multicopper oxidase with cupredoxin domain
MSNDLSIMSADDVHRYHSHHTAQYGQGVVGPIIFDGPSTANYDEDLGVLPLSDWYYDSVYELLSQAMHFHGPPGAPNNVLVNGTMIDGNGNGQYQKLYVEAGKKYRLRFVNTAMDHLFHVSMDGHPFTVIQADFVPAKPYQTTDLKINVGQRYDIVFEASQDIANYWLRVSAAAPGPQGPICGGALIYGNNITNPVVGAILSYAGAPDTLPISTAYANDGNCGDETFVPYFTTPMSGQYNLDALNITSGGPTEPVVHWYINGSTMDGESPPLFLLFCVQLLTDTTADWENPTLAFIRDQKPFTPNMNVVEMPQANSWYLWVVENALSPPIPHPIHLHGHDFEVLGSGVGPFPWGQDFVTGATPIRRDVATLPGSPDGGWLLVGVYTDNPGAWLMHCHIGWHASQGLSMQFVERQSEILGSIGSLDCMEQGCTAWTDYWNSADRTGAKIDSGF